MINQSKPLLNGLILKVLASIVGYGLWIALANSQIKQLELSVPISFGELNPSLQISSPQTINAKISGKRADLQRLDFKSLGAYLNLNELNQAGSYQLHISPQQLFLPNKIKLLEYYPVVIDIKLSN